VLKGVPRYAINTHVNVKMTYDAVTDINKLVG